MRIQTTNTKLDKSNVDQYLRKLYRDADLVDGISEIITKYCVGKKVLDIGCVGFLDDELSQFHRLISESSSFVCGVDIDKKINSFSKSSHSEYHCINIEDECLQDQFDVVAMFDVIEHLSNPGKMLFNIVKMMGDDSKIIITTPNPFGLRYLIQSIFKVEPTQHPQHSLSFSVYNIAELSVRYGLEVEKCLYVAGQTIDSNSSLKQSVYSIFYRTLMKLFKARADTIGIVLRKKK